MNKILSIVLCMIPHLLMAQIRIQNISLKHSDSALLYVGVANIIKVSGIDNKDKFELTSSIGELSTIDLDQYQLKVTSAVKTDTLNVFQNGKLLFSKVYEVKLLSEPSVKLGNILSNYASIVEIEKNKNLSVLLPNWEYKAAFNVVNFRLTIQNHFGKIVSNDEINMGNSISKNQLKIIKQLEIGSKLIFENIKVIGPDKIERLFPSITITIK